VELVSYPTKIKISSNFVEKSFFINYPLKRKQPEKMEKVKRLSKFLGFPQPEIKIKKSS
jgi:hypothetical protein